MQSFPLRIVTLMIILTEKNFFIGNGDIYIRNRNDFVVKSIAFIVNVSREESIIWALGDSGCRGQQQQQHRPMSLLRPQPQTMTIRGETFPKGFLPPNFWKSQSWLAEGESWRRKLLQSPRKRWSSCRRQIVDVNAESRYHSLDNVTPFPWEGPPSPPPAAALFYFREISPFLLFFADFSENRWKIQNDIGIRQQFWTRKIPFTDGMGNIGYSERRVIGGFMSCLTVLRT